MSHARESVKRAISVINETPAGSMQSTALTGLINGVQQFVQGVDEEKNLVREFPTLKKELDNLKGKLNEGKIEDREKKSIETDIQDIEKTLRAAKKASSQVRNNRVTLIALNNEVKKLLTELRRALD